MDSRDVWLSTRPIRMTMSRRRRRRPQIRYTCVQCAFRASPIARPIRGKRWLRVRSTRVETEQDSRAVAALVPSPAGCANCPLSWDAEGKVTHKSIDSAVHGYVVTPVVCSALGSYTPAYVSIYSTASPYCRPPSLSCCMIAAHARSAFSG